METIHGEPSWRITNGETDVYVTKRGAHTAPVTFFADDERPVRPHFVAPWNTDDDMGRDLDPPVLAPLRGDFLCLPFGEDNRYEGESHPVHGEAAGGAWEFVGEEQTGRRTAARLRFSPRQRAGTIAYEISLVKGHSAVYQRHLIEGFHGPTTLAHHVILRGDTPLCVDTPPLAFGVTNAPGPRYAAGGEYHSIERDRVFTTAERVPSVWAADPYVDVSRFPRREGFDDIVQLVPDYAEPAIGWVTATAPEEGWLWYALKDPKVLPSTVMWMENRGRHASPWNGRTVALGIEDACGYLATGLAGSVPDNPVSRRGVPTYHDAGAEPTAVNYIQGVCRIPEGFDRVHTISVEADRVVFRAHSGEQANARVFPEFIQTGTIP